MDVSSPQVVGVVFASVMVKPARSREVPHTVHAALWLA